MTVLDRERRADWLELVELVLALLAAIAYIYVIGWVISWVRLLAARVPVDAALPALNHQVVFLAGLRLVIVMAIVFAAMCVAAYAVHAFNWGRRGAEWHSVIKHGRPGAAARHRDRPATAMDAPVGDRFVRVIAGFDVGVIAGTFALAFARIVKTSIDQAFPPAPWWDLLLPWLLVTAVLSVALARLGPLWGNRFLHAGLWIVVIVVALVSSAPFGLLLLTWAGVASFGRTYGKLRSQRGQGALASGHPRHLSFVLSPLPWMLLTVYALVGIAYYGLPPVTFSQATVTTPTGIRVGGYIARNGSGAYLVTCTPLADATSTNERVSAVPVADIKSLTTSTTPFVVDSGLRPSLPTVLLHALGIEASTPAWIRPEVRTIRPTCAGDPLPASTVGSLAPQLGAGVIAGPAPPGGRALDGEPPIEQTSPAAIAALARRYQPTVLVTVADPFWPVSVGAVLDDRGANGQVTCLQEAKGTCPREACPARAHDDFADRGGKRTGRLPRVSGLAGLDQRPQPPARRLPARPAVPAGRASDVARAPDQPRPGRSVAHGRGVLLLRAEHESGELARPGPRHHGQLHRAPVLVLLPV